MANKTKRASRVPVLGPWLPVSLEFLRSRAFASLSPYATKMLFDLASQLDAAAANNGRLSAADAVMRLRGWTSNANRQAAIAELIDAALVVITRMGNRKVPRLFAITLWPLHPDPTLQLGPGAYAMRDWESTMPGAADQLHPRVFAGDRSMPPPATWHTFRKNEPRNQPNGEISAPTAGLNGSALNPQRVATRAGRHTFKPATGGKAAAPADSLTPPRVPSLDKPSGRLRRDGQPAARTGRKRQPVVEIDGKPFQRALCAVAGCPHPQCRAGKGEPHALGCKFEPCPICRTDERWVSCRCTGRLTVRWLSQQPRKSKGLRREVA